MSVFHLYLKLGLEHIADIQSYDHILFIISLCIIYPLNQWSHILLLITAFTIGHSFTLALATLRIISVNVKLIEFLIPVTIFLSALMNLFQKSDKFKPGTFKIKYGVALFFGLIHGLGFSGYLRSMLGKEESIVLPLFSFNVGIELGQILIITCFIALSLLFVDLLKVKRREWVLVLSGIAMGVAMLLMKERFPWTSLLHNMLQ
jgi:hypothetical protein